MTGRDLFQEIGNIREEFVAEAIAEYVSSESPRPLCKKVGEILDRKYKDYMRLL